MTPAGTFARSSSQYALAVSTSGALGARKSFSSLWPLLNVHTRSWSTKALTPAPTLTPIVVEASSLVRRLHGSIATGDALAPLPPEPGVGSVDGEVMGLGVAIGTDEAFSVPTATGVADDGAAGLVLADGPPAPVEQAASATAVTEMSVIERFVRMRVETSVSTIDRRR